MDAGYNAQYVCGEYKLTFETNNRAYFLAVEEAARKCVDCTATECTHTGTAKMDRSYLTKTNPYNTEYPEANLCNNN